MSNRFPPEPAIRADRETTKIYLPIPSFDQVSRFDPPLSVVMNERRSHRTASVLPLSREDLGHFLYRCAFVHGLARTPHGEFTRRVYPSGGGSYELEIYLLVTRVSGLYPGVYLYDGSDNSLIPVEGDLAAYRSMLADAYTAAADSIVPDVLFVLASRIKRISWKYSAICYATTLKNVGVLYANMYLVGTAMELAPCALGLGNSDAFARLTGTDYLSECAVGEFMLSRRN
jgi:SagB-type dehydrogenase family enzyme